MQAAWLASQQSHANAMLTTFSFFKLKKLSLLIYIVLHIWGKS
jgi:hypothetical protein